MPSSDGEDHDWQPPEMDEPTESEDFEYPDDYLDAIDEAIDDFGDADEPLEFQGITNQVLQHYNGGGLYETLNAIIDEFEENFVDEDDHGVDQLIYDDAEFEIAWTDPYGEDDEPDSFIIRNRRIAVLARPSRSNRRLLLTRDQAVYYLRHKDEANEPPRERHLSRREFERWVARHRPDPNRFPKVPSVEGRKLMESRSFGVNEPPGVREVDKNKDLALRILDRELGIYHGAERTRQRRLLLQEMIPISRAETTIHFAHPVYSGQFSEDGNFFFSCGHDLKIRMYDTSDPYKWKYYKTVRHPWAQWTITDGSLSPDNKWLAYTSFSPSICLAPTDPDDKGDPYTLDLSANAEGEPAVNTHFGLFSVRFSGDGRELIAGTNAPSIVVYDIETRQALHRMNKAHYLDVNAVCFADPSSPHVLYSGSDDSVIKVWDRRSMGDSRPAGAFVGHIEGITYIDSKNDGRYILSNGKDQSMKLWDLRMAMSTERFEEARVLRAPTFDYRWEEYNENYWYRDQNDNSVVTFRGHQVQRTLIRCHFSPPGSSDSRYVYSGSFDGHVYIWNLDATLAGTIDVGTTTYMARAATKRFRAPFMSHAYKSLVRDASWHPNVPVIAASSFSGNAMREGNCSLHTFQQEVYHYERDIDDIPEGPWEDCYADDSDGEERDPGNPDRQRYVNEKMEPEFD